MNAVTKKVDTTLPAYMTENKKSAFQTNMDAGDMMVPRVKLLQALSPELKDFKGEAQAGTFWHNGMQAEIGESFEFFVVRSRKFYILFAPRGDDQGPVLARADDGIHWSPADAEFKVKPKGAAKPVIWKTAATVEKSGLDQFGTSIPGDNDSQPAATMIYEYVIWLPEHPELGAMLLSLARSQIKKAKNMNYSINTAQHPTALKFKAEAIEEKGAEGPYYNYLFKRAGMANDEEYNQSEEFAKRFSNISYKGVGDDRDESAEAVGGGAAPGDVPADVAF